MKKRICIVLAKNTAEIDYLLPIINYCNYKIDIFTFNYSKNNIVKKNSLLNNYLKKKKIKVYDLKDLQHKNSFLLNFLANKIEDNSFSIKHNFYSLFEKFSIFLLLLFFKNLINRIYKEIFHLLLNYKDKKFFIKNKYEYILIGHRNFINQFFYKVFKENFKKLNNKIIFVPHGPHYAKKYNNNLTDTEKTLINKNYLNLIPNNLEKPWLNKIYKENRCLNYGYPLFYFKKFKFSKKKNKLKLLVIGRRFDLKQKIDIDVQFTSNQESFEYFINHLKKLDKKKYDIFFKPHPSTNIKILNYILKKFDLNHLKIMQDPIIFNIKSFDCVYSFHSTALLLPIFHEIPVIYYNSPMVKKHIKWKQVLEMYNYVAAKINKDDDLNYSISLKYKKKLLSNRLKISKFFIKKNPRNFFKEVDKYFKIVNNYFKIND